MEKTGAVLAAAGLSSRMHGYKPLLPYRNSTISGYLVQMMKKLELSPVVVVTGYRGDELEEYLSQFQVTFVRNKRYRETQMFDSIQLGIQAAAPLCTRILIMPMDIPSIRLDTFRQVLKASGPIIQTVCGDIPGHPVVIERDTALKLCAYEGDGGLRGAIQASGLPVTRVEVQDMGISRDVDTREEYQRLLALARAEDREEEP